MTTDVRALLERTQTIAVVGLSRHPSKAAYAIPHHLQACGFRIIPVNPHASELLGERSYPRLADVPDEVDLVDVFRPADEAPEIVQQAVERGFPAVWLQSGIRSPEAQRLAEDAGIAYVENRCLGVDVSMLGIRCPD
jgi:uncharacterized protein